MWLPAVVAHHGLEGRPQNQRVVGSIPCSYCHMLMCPGETFNPNLLQLLHHWCMNVYGLI